MRAILPFGLLGAAIGAGAASAAGNIGGEEDLMDVQLDKR
jgi:hypothetical protein